MAVDFEKIWKSVGFNPNDRQREAIFHASGPLFLPAGPGSGKTRVLLWRTVNLIVNGGVDPGRIFLSTFTEKAAKQLKEGLQVNLTLVSGATNKNYDISQMYVGTVHSLCQKILTDKRLNRTNLKRSNIETLDQLGQVLFLSEYENWNALSTAVDVGGGFERFVMQFTEGNSQSSSKIKAAINLAGLFNKISEEDIDLSFAAKQCSGESEIAILEIYKKYLELLENTGPIPKVDLSLLQQRAFRHISSSEALSKSFDHVIVDEYQDTNSIQEKIFFSLGVHSKNICVVGDDDQALYRFRGATVENFLDFRKKCAESLKTDVKAIPLDINYRSKSEIVEVSQKLLNTISWQDPKNKKNSFRITDKEIKAGRKDEGPAVFKTEGGEVEYCADLIAEKCKEMLDRGVVQTPSQMAFLFNSVAPTGKAVQAMQSALEEKGFQIYSPRSENFLAIDEVQRMLALIIRILGLKSESETRFNRGDWGAFQSWLQEVDSVATETIRSNKLIESYVQRKQAELADGVTAFRLVAAWFAEKGIGDKDHITQTILNDARKTLKLGQPYQQRLQSQMLTSIVARGALPDQRKLTARAFSTIVTSLDWGLLDLFWQLLGFAPFKNLLDQVSSGIDRGAMNLSRLSHLLDRFVDHEGSILRPRDFSESGFSRRFLNKYLYGLWVTKESGVEDDSAGFPRECIPFLTIHQSKGLEFPVVVIGNPKKGVSSYDPEEFVKRISSRKYFEPPNRIPEFDLIRLYYVAFTRAQNVLIVPHFDESRNRVTQHIADLFETVNFHLLEELDIKNLSNYEETEKARVENYSFTSDYQFFDQCPRQYMLFRYIDFTPARTQSMFFGSLVHKTIEDLHHRLIARRLAKKVA